MYGQSYGQADELSTACPDATTRDAYADDVDWQLDWQVDEHGTNVPWIRHRSSRAEVTEHYRTIAAHHDPERATVQISRILVDGADVVVMGTISNTVSRTNKSYPAHFALHLTVADGLVLGHHVYEDSLSVARAWMNG